MSLLINFYAGTGTDCEGRTLTEILMQNDGYLEYAHDWVQWLFPLIEPSNFNSDAPLLTTEDIQTFRKSPALQLNLKASFIRFIKFLDIEYNEGNLIIWRFVQFEQPNHNWFRITRVLTSLMLLGLEKEAKLFFNLLQDLHDRGYVSNNSFAYWQKAVLQNETKLDNKEV